MAGSNHLAFRFDARRATEVAVRLLQLAGGSMEYVRILKLLYMVDREGLSRRNRPVCGDHYVSMEHGPVLSTVYDIIKGNTPDQTWDGAIEKLRFNVQLRDGVPAPSATLSSEERGIIVDVHERWRDVGTWDMVKQLHSTLPEWTNPGKSSFPINPRRIFQVLGRSDDEIDDIAANVLARQEMLELLSR